MHGTTVLGEKEVDTHCQHVQMNKGALRACNGLGNEMFPSNDRGGRWISNYLHANNAYASSHCIR